MTFIYWNWYNISWTNVACLILFVEFFQHNYNFTFQPVEKYIKNTKKIILLKELSLTFLQRFIRFLNYSLVTFLCQNVESLQISERINTTPYSENKLQRTNIFFKMSKLSCITCVFIIFVLRRHCFWWVELFPGTYSFISTFLSCSNVTTIFAPDAFVTVLSLIQVKTWKRF